MPILLEDLQGNYEIRYSSVPQMDGWFEPGTGHATISGNTLKGTDALGVYWDATFILEGDDAVYEAVLDPSTAPPGVGLLNKNGQMTREKVRYNGRISATKNGPILVLKTRVLQGPITINVQFIKVQQ